MKVTNQKKSKLLFSASTENSILYINLSTLIDNWKQLLFKIKNSQLAVSIKANAYGLGLERIGKELKKIGCKSFFVASANEAFALRKLDKKVNIFLLSNGYEKDINIKLIKNNIILVLNNKNDLKNINKVSKYLNKKIKCAIQFDVGMNRLGFDFDDLTYVSKYIEKTIDVVLVIGHLSCSENKKSSFNTKQLNQFKKIKSCLAQYNLSFSLANSNAVFLGKDYHYDMCRVGGILYGLGLNKGLPKKIKPVSSLKSKILQVRFVAKGGSIGYGAKYIVKKNSKIATLGIGYADGLSRNYNGFAYYKGKKINFVGNISMDLSNLDVTNIKNIKENDWVEIFGENLSINKMASNSNTISYELLSRLGSRVERVYIYNK